MRPLMKEESGDDVWRPAIDRRQPRWRVLALGIIAAVGALVVLLTTSSVPSDMLYSHVARLGHQQPDCHHHERHDSVKVVVVNVNKNKVYTDSGHPRKHEKSKKEDSNNIKEDTSFIKRAGEIGGHVDVNKTCAEAYSTPTFRDFGKLFRHLVGSRATRLDNHTWSFDFNGYSSLQWVEYNETAMTLDVVIVQGFQVFQSFHEVFAFEDLPKHPGICRIHRKQYIILTDKGPVSWEDMEAQGKAELKAMYDLFGP